MILYLLDHEAVCPVCSGCVKRIQSAKDQFLCQDCKRVFFFAGFGQTEREIEVYDRTNDNI